jgi:hypothetical protein
MEAAVAMIREQCQMDRLGGRVHVMDDLRTCVVYDVSHVSSRLVEKLQACAHVEIFAESTSLSGYVLRITLKPNKVKRVVTTAAALACMCAVVTQCLRRDI